MKHDQQYEIKGWPEGMRTYWRCCRFVARSGLLLLLRPTVIGTRNVPLKDGVLLVSNHQSYLDPVLVTMAPPRESCYMARDTLWKDPRFARLITSLNAFPVKRSTADIGAIKQALRQLKRGMALVVFPEGTRTPDGRIQSLLPGLAAIAQKSRVPIVPTLIDGVFRCWPRTSKFPSPGNVIVQYDQKIAPEEYADLSAKQLMERIRYRLLRMQHRLHTRVPERRFGWYEPDWNKFLAQSGAKEV
jgi:1-acyl-sn-glycerol-3-phosphate acyltransferase